MLGDGVCVAVAGGAMLSVIAHAAAMPLVRQRSPVNDFLVLLLGGREGLPELVEARRGTR